jgi:hypothetical protein
VIYLDSPVGVGLSYAKDKSKAYVTGDLETVHDLHTFLLEVQRITYKGSSCWCSQFIICLWNKRLNSFSFLLLINSGFGSTLSSWLIHFT